MKISLAILIILVTICLPGDVGSNQIIKQSLDSFVRNGIGFRFSGKLTSGSAGKYRLCFYLQLPKVRKTLEALRQEIINVTDVLQGGFKWKKMTSQYHYHPDEYNKEVENNFYEFRDRITSKRSHFLAQLQTLSETIEYFQFLVESQDHYSRSRLPRRSGIFSGIGSLLQVFFGTALTSDTDKISERLDEMWRNEKKIVNYVNSLTSVVTEIQQSFDTVQNETLQVVNNSLQEFQKKVLDLVVDVAYTQTLSIIRLQSSIDVATEKVNTQLAVFSSHIQKWVHGLMQVLNGKFPLEVVPSDKLICYLNEIESVLPKGVSLAISDFKSNKILDTVKHSQCYLESDKLNILMVCNFELAKLTETYFLYKMFPAPIAVKNMSAFGKPLYSVIDNVNSNRYLVGKESLSVPLRDLKLPPLVLEKDNLVRLKDMTSNQIIIYILCFMFTIAIFIIAFLAFKLKQLWIVTIIDRFRKKEVAEPVQAEQCDPLVVGNVCPESLA